MQSNKTKKHLQVIQNSVHYFSINKGYEKNINTNINHYTKIINQTA